MDQLTDALSTFGIAMSKELNQLTEQLKKNSTTALKNDWWSLFAEQHTALPYDQIKVVWDALYEEEPLKFAWVPDKGQRSNLTTYIAKSGHASYDEYFQWSITDKTAFWKDALEALKVSFDESPSSILNLDKGAENPVWLQGAKLNIIDSCFTAPKDKIALTTCDEEGLVTNYSYEELDELSNRVANGLVNLGLTPGARVVMYLPFTLEAVAAYLGIIKAGMIAVSVADSFSAAELAKRIEISEASLVIGCDGYTYHGKWLPVYDKIQEAKAPQTILSTYNNSETRENDIKWADFLGDSHFTSVKTQPDETINILFSSGTTKAPKAIPWTHMTPIKSAMDGHLHQDITSDDTVTWTTGMGWMMAPWLIFATLINEATLALFTGSAAHEEFGRFMETSKTTIIGTIPSLVKNWKKSRMMEDRNLAVRVWSSTGEPSNEDDYFYLMYLSKFKAPIIEYCGGTEIGGGYITGTVLHPCAPATFTTPALGMGFYLFDEDSPSNEQGEVKLTPPSMGLSQKLLNRDHHEEYYKGQPLGPKGETLRKHGDAYITIASPVDGHTYYRCLGRTDDAMNIGGIKVSAVELEEVIEQHESIFASAAVSVNTSTTGPGMLVIFAEMGDGEFDLDAVKKEIQGLVSKQLNPLFRIGDLVSIEKLPRTASNKVMRRKLRDLYAAS